MPFSRSFLRFVSRLKARATDYPGALELARQAATDSDEYRDYVWLGNLLGVVGEQARTEGRTSESEEMAAEGEKVLRHAVGLADDVVETWSALIQFLSMRGRTQEAEEAIKQGSSKISADKRALAEAGVWTGVDGI